MYKIDILQCILANINSPCHACYNILVTCIYKYTLCFKMLEINFYNLSEHI